MANQVAERALGRLDHLTFRGNLRDTRFGWLRLTPAYSVHLVGDLLDEHGVRDGRVLDPFCGTGTTALVCAERGIACDTTDINPFLVWLARAKTARYRPAALASFRADAARVTKAMGRASKTPPWTPPLHQIEKWWPERTLHALGRAMDAIAHPEKKRDTKAGDLLKVAFLRTMIGSAKVSFGHQSMSFAKTKRGATTAPADDVADVAARWEDAVTSVEKAAASEIRAIPEVIACDARHLGQELATDRYGCVITSPPYPNRMSYVRELRPYMYWLRYLSDGKQAGELDWKAIGGTWGVATSKVGQWEPESAERIPYRSFERIVRDIGKTSDTLARYVAKYFHDVVAHARSVFDVVAPNGSVHYIVGNSKFYDVLLPVERIYAATFEAVGFRDAHVRTIRKRTSKKELFEYVVSAKKIGAR